MQAKTCNKCGELKKISEFAKCSSGKYGVIAVCKECKRQEWRSKRVSKGLPIRTTSVIAHDHNGNPYGKVCTSCGTEKPFNMFYSAKNGSYGVRGVCKECDNKTKTERITRKAEKNKYVKEFLTGENEYLFLKTCTKCGRELSMDKFFKDLSKKDFHRPDCVDCSKKTAKKYRDNIESFRVKPKKTKKCIKCGERFPINNFSKDKYRPDGFGDMCKSCKSKRDKVVKNKDSYRKKKNEYEYAKYNNDTDYRIAKLLRSRIRSALNGAKKIDNTLSLLGCDLEYFKSHLEKTMTEGMTWEKYMAGEIEIDHIRPCRSFDLSDPKQQRQCFHYKNMQFMWALENRSKGAFYKGVHYRYV